MSEIWRDIPGYEDLYQASNTGRIRSLCYNHTKETRIMTPWISPKGYEYVHLCKNGKAHSVRVSRIIATVFVPNPQDKLFVDHIDTDRRNNNAKNLKWCDQSENQKNPISAKRYGLAKSKPIIQLSLNGDFIKVWPSAYEAVRSGGFNRNLIRKVIAGTAMTHRGFKWRYLNGEEEEN